jgi:hypothetical protein
MQEPGTVRADGKISRSELWASVAPTRSADPTHCQPRLPELGSDVRLGANLFRTASGAEAVIVSQVSRYGCIRGPSTFEMDQCSSGIGMLGLQSSSGLAKKAFESVCFR